MPTDYTAILRHTGTGRTSRALRYSLYLQSLDSPSRNDSSQPFCDALCTALYKFRGVMWIDLTAITSEKSEKRSPTMRPYRSNDPCSSVLRFRSTAIALSIPVALVLLLYCVYTNTPSNGTQPSGNSSEAPLDVSVLAFYFPQFHEFEENDRFWGKGFTDHTNLMKVRRNRFGQPVIRPAERNGMGLLRYNQAWESHRRFQGKLAKRYGIDGFAIMHYWFDDHAVMDTPLQGRLKDGQPGIPYCIFWANEHWTKKWDGLDGSEMLLKQTYNQSTWIQHLQYLLPFFNDPGYIKVDGKPLFVIYRASDIPDLPRMLGVWNVYLSSATDIPGLHVVQILGSKWTEKSHELASGASGFVEYYPNLYNGPQWPVSKLLTTHEPTSQAKRYHGVPAAWDNTPRHLTDGQAYVFPNHPSIFQYALQQNLARTSPGGFVFVNAWNEWGEGAAIEPSVEWGRRWLEAVHQAKTNMKLGHFMDLDSQGNPVRLRLPPAGVQKSVDEAANRGCIVVRTYEGHENAMFSIRQFISTLQALNIKSWDAFFVNTDVQPYANLGTIIGSYGDERLHLVVPPSSIDRAYVGKVSAYHIVDWIISAQCDSSEYDWLLVTNGDNWYTPDALNYLPVSHDMVLMNFYGHYSWVNDMRFGNGTALDNCCERLYTETCSFASPKIGFVDLGSVVFNLERYKKQAVTFMQFTGACGSFPCQDGALVQALVEVYNWSYTSHDLGVCAFHHNANPQSCAMIGGVYFDSLDYGRAGCFDLTSLPLGWGDINWDAFTNSKAACVCQRYEAFSQWFFEP